MRADLDRAVQIGVSPRRYAGWEPRTVLTLINGEWNERREPEWSDLDRALLNLHDQWKSECCPVCGKHEHAGKAEGVPLLRNCPDTELLDAAQARHAKKNDKRFTDEGRNPERWRAWSWITKKMARTLAEQHTGGDDG